MKMPFERSFNLQMLYLNLVASAPVEGTSRSVKLGQVPMPN